MAQFPLQFQTIAAEVKGLLRKEKGLTTTTNYNLFLLAAIIASEETGATLAYGDWRSEKLVDSSPSHIINLNFTNGDKVLFAWRPVQL